MRLRPGRRVHIGMLSLGVTAEHDLVDLSPSLVTTCGLPPGKQPNSAVTFGVEMASEATDFAPRLSAHRVGVRVQAGFGATDGPPSTRARKEQKRGKTVNLGVLAGE